MNCKKILEKFNEYNKLNFELEQASLNYSTFKQKTEGEISSRFDALASNIQRFCGSESFHSVIKNFCYLYSDTLSVSGGNLAYRGSVPAPCSFNSDNAAILAEQCVNDIKSSFKVLAQKNSNADAAIKKLCVSFSTLRVINASIGELKTQAIKKCLAEENQRIEAMKQRIRALLIECPDLASPEKIEEQLANVKTSVQKDIDRFYFKGITVPTNYALEIVLPFAKSADCDEYETGIKYWNPTKDGILHVSIPSGRYEIASDFIIALTMQFFHAYPLLDKQILYCCQNSLSRMDSFLKNIKDACKEKVFFHGIEQLEADTFYQEIVNILKYLRDEVKRRSCLMDAALTESIYEYNATENADIISPILVFLHDYPTGFSGCRDLGYFFRECARFGVFCVVLQTDFETKYSNNDMIDPATYKGLHCSLDENGSVVCDDTVLESVAINRARVLPLLTALAENADKGKKTSYLSYEDIGFGAIDKNADGYCTKLSIPIGKVNGKPFSLDFATSSSEEDQKKGIKTPLAYLVVGGPGSGKSTLIDSLIINGSMAYSPDDLIFYLLDFKDGITASFYDGDDAIPHVRMIAAQSKEEDSDIILSGLIAEKERRNELFKTCGTGDITGYNGKSCKKLPRIIVIVDECQNLFSSDVLAEKCEKLAREGRSAGIHLVLASQDAKLNMMQHAGKFIDGRFCFFTPSQSDAAQVINNSYTKALNVDVPKGSGLAYMSLENGENCKKIQIAFHGGDKSGNKAEYNRKIREKWKKVNYGINLIKAGENRPLLLSSFSNAETPLISEAPSVANIGENYFDHSMFGIDLSKDTSHSILLLGDNEKPSTDILTSVMTKALSIGGEIKLIDESMDLSLASFFGSHPSVTTYTKDDYLSVLGEVYGEFERRKQDFRARYKPYFFIINSLYRIDDYRTDKKPEHKEGEVTDMADFDGDMMAFYATMTANATSAKDVLGKTSLLTMLSEIGNTSNMFIIIATNSNLSNDYEERKVFSGCGYKILQNSVSAEAYQIMDNSFREKMMDGLNENIVFISNRGSFTKCRYFQYDWNDEKTKQLVVAATRQVLEKIN